MSTRNKLIIIIIIIIIVVVIIVIIIIMTFISIYRLRFGDFLSMC